MSRQLIVYKPFVFLLFDMSRGAAPYAFRHGGKTSTLLLGLPLPLMFTLFAQAVLQTDFVKFY